MKKLIMILFATILLVSCATKIGNLKKNPEKYIGQIVNVRGEVTKLVKIPFTEYSFFEIRDTSDNIIVFSLNEHTKGDLITFKAKVIGYDSTKQESSTLIVIDAVKTFILDNIKVDEDKIKKSSEVIGKTLIKALDVSNGTYLLIEQRK